MLNKTDVLRRINHFWEAKSQRGKEQIFEDILDYRVYVPKHFWIDLIEANLEPFSKIVLFDEKLVSALDVESKLINFLSDPCHINRRKASKRLIGDQSGKALKAFTNRLEKETDKVVIGSLLSAISYFSKETSLYYILKNYSNVNSILEK
jgi:hypothetical protein